MYRNLLSLAILAGITIFVSCSGGADKHAIAIPKDAAFVMHINAPALSQKISWEEIKSTNWFSKLYAEAEGDTIAKGMLDNPESTGINLQEDLVSFAKRRGRSGYFSFQGTLKDAAAFETFMKKVVKNATASKDGDINILAGDGKIVTWNANRFVMIGSTPDQRDFPMFDDENAFRSSRPGAEFTTDSLVKFAKELYTLSGDNSLYNDKRFANLMKEPGDMHFWFSAEHAAAGGLGGAASMLKISTLTEGTVAAFSVNFENGKITGKSKSYYNKELSKLVEKYRMKNIEASTLSRIPSQDIVGLITFNYPPEGLKEFFRVIGVDGIVNEGLGRVNFTMDEFIKANKGDILLAFTDLSMKEASGDVTMSMDDMMIAPRVPDFKVLFAASIRDKASFEKLVSTLRSQMGDDASRKAGLPDVSFSMNDNWFAAGNSVEMVNQFLAGGDNKWSLAGKLGGHPSIFYLDMQKCMKPFAGDSTDNTERAAMLRESMRMWENIIGTGGDLVDGALIGDFEVNLVDKNTNALKQLNQWADKMSALDNKKAF